MRRMTCAVCGSGFSGRSDAVYCSSACRQRAHRARSARRTAALRDSLRRSAGTARDTPSDVARSLQRSVADAVQRARRQVDRSRELCRASELRLRESDAIRRASLESGSSRSYPERASWPGI
ncbi:hypothetical protein U8D42_18130 [Mycobacterium europaeum]|uniref:hypothetical protein n=1 Tax=Mycobacterium europaeum TaxID=761804 RepID=UPI002ADEFFD0|nr:hypothetical protein [Mycobacterium europaeum]MEA1158729.1 hypothetical protein [Mycobacterium europaeum]